MSSGKQYTEKQIEYLKEISRGRSNKEITKIFNEKFNQNRTAVAIKGVRERNGIKNGLDGKFKKGHIPWCKGTKGIMKSNSGSFKEGNIPENYKPVGSERKTPDGYWEIKTEDPKTWEFKHRIMYEKYHNVELKASDIIIFGDSDKDNFSKDNLIKINRQQLALLNKNSLIQDHTETTRTAVYLVDLKSKLAEVKGGRSKC